MNDYYLINKIINYGVFTVLVLAIISAWIFSNVIVDKLEKNGSLNAKIAKKFILVIVALAIWNVQFISAINPLIAGVVSLLLYLGYFFSKIWKNKQKKPKQEFL